jgi:hypothetical protein
LSIDESKSTGFEEFCSSDRKLAASVCGIDPKECSDLSTEFSVERSASFCRRTATPLVSLASMVAYAHSSPRCTQWSQVGRPPSHYSKVSAAQPALQFFHLPSASVSDTNCKRRAGAGARLCEMKNPFGDHDLVLWNCYRRLRQSPSCARLLTV